MSKLTLPQLERHLFAAADILRGKEEPEESEPDPDALTAAQLKALKRELTAAKRERKRLGEQLVRRLQAAHDALTARLAGCLRQLGYVA